MAPLRLEVLVHVWTAELLEFLVRHVPYARAVVQDGQVAPGVVALDTVQSAVVVRPALVGNQGFDDPPRDLCQLVPVVDRDGLPAPDDDGGFQLLRAHDRSDAVVPGGVTPVAHDGGPADKVLSRRADRQDAELAFGSPQFIAERVHRLPGVLADQVGGIPELRVAFFVDQQVGPAFAGALEDQAHEACETHEGPERTLPLSGSGAAGERSFGAHGDAAGAGYGSAAERSGEDHQPVAGVGELHIRRHLVVQILRAERTAAHVCAECGLVDVLKGGVPT